MTIYLLNVFNLYGHVVCLVIGCNKSLLAFKKTVFQFKINTFAVE